MPDMNGKELYDNLQKIYPELKSLFMSGYTADIVVHSGVSGEGDHFIQKPFTQKDIAMKIHSILTDSDNQLPP